ncbi:iron-sulfur cluster carrier protein ApbC [Thalassotalea atypica]|uniref:iron-sulfur cluster carrier protein ApbC n=1 Tax=Thalassotalea atypica TaxID=2054316 RepID=UPI003D9AE43D
MTLFSKLFSGKSDEIGDDRYQEIIEQTLANYRSESFPEGILPVCRNLTVSSNKKQSTVAITVPFPCVGELQLIADNLSTSLAVQVNFKVSLDVKPVRAHRIKPVANIIAIASGKGGVGKSTTTVNLAYALMSEGAKVGILDADIYGPSIPTMLGVQDDKPSSADGKLMQPIMKDDIASMSIGYLVDDSEAMVWRGPMASGAFGQLLNETAWPELDYLLIDMPPGTGDIQLTLAQKVPVAGAVVITTPQDIALADAQKGIVMFDKVKVPVLGIVENMSYHLCENCGHQSHLFGREGGKDIAELNHVDLLGQLPLDIAIREDGDLGESSIFKAQGSDLSNQYRKIARNIASKVFNELDMRSQSTPDVVIESK